MRRSVLLWGHRIAGCCGEQGRSKAELLQRRSQDESTMAAKRLIMTWQQLSDMAKCTERSMVADRINGATNAQSRLRWPCKSSCMGRACATTELRRVLLSCTSTQAFREAGECSSRDAVP
eukprot:SAG11_NODE_3009_length_2769_cov_1.646816_2_plen_120_part_00